MLHLFSIHVETKCFLAPTLTCSTLSLAPPPHWPLPSLTPPLTGLRPLTGSTSLLAPPSHWCNPLISSTFSLVPHILPGSVSTLACFHIWCLSPLASDCDGVSSHSQIAGVNSRDLQGRGSASTETVLGEPVASWDVAYSPVERKAGTNL